MSALNWVAAFRLAIAFAAFASCFGIRAEPAYAARVVAVVDGDTIKARSQSGEQRTIRLSGIDAPEKGQAFGERSKQALSALAFGKMADIEPRKIDRYGRSVALVRIAAMDVSLTQVQSGMAWHFKRYSREQPAAERLAYAIAEEEARERRLGLWQDRAPEAPWDWRRQRAGEQRGARAEQSKTGAGR